MKTISLSNEETLWLTGAAITMLEVDAENQESKKRLDKWRALIKKLRSAK